MGNTNFSIHLPRSSFNRHVTAQLVLRAVRSLGVDASINDRNDVCVGPYKMSFLWLSQPYLMNKNSPISTCLALPTRLRRIEHTTMARCSSRRSSTHWETCCTSRKYVSLVTPPWGKTSDRHNGCLGVYDNPRRRVGSLASEEFARIQPNCNSCSIRGSDGSSLPRGIPHRKTRTSTHKPFLTTSHGPLLLAQAQYVQAEDATDIPFIQSSISEMPVGVTRFSL